MHLVLFITLKDSVIKWHVNVNVITDDITLLQNYCRRL